MFCMNCGTKLPDHARFCFNCGAKIPEGLDDVCKRLGLVYELKNDAPRGGKAGDYLEFRKSEK